MAASSQAHEKLAYRLTTILAKLNSGQKLKPEALAEEFKCTVRTVQRDLNNRFEFLNLQVTEDGYALEPTRLGHLSLRDIERFAALAGVQNLFPSLNTDFLREILSNKEQHALMVKGPHYEDLGDKKRVFQQIEAAISARHFVSFVYHKAEGSKTYTQAKPYKLVNNGGIWYLAAQDGDKLKAFSFGKVDRLLVSGDTFTPDPAVESTLQAEDDIWLNPDKTEVVLQVARAAASYFQRRRLIANQHIEKELEDGGLLVSGKVAHPNQILPIVRYWLPHIRIISPEGLQGEMEEEMRGYLGGCR